MVKQIFINASEMASLCGMHKYRPSEVAMVEVWRRNYRTEAEGIGLSSLGRLAYSSNVNVIQKLARENIILENKNKVSSSTQILTELQTIKFDNDGVPEDGARAGVILAKVLTERAKLVACAKTTSHMNDLDKHLATCLDPSILSEYTGAKHCARGIVNETNDINKFEKETGMCVEDRNEHVYSKEILTTCDDEHKECEYIVRGKVDGTSNGDTVIESKNRMRRLFKFIPEYEQVQLEVYMWLTGYDKAILIENFNLEQSVLNYDQSPTKWSEIETNFGLFHEQLQMFRSDPDRNSRAEAALMNGRNFNRFKII